MDQEASFFVKALADETRQQILQLVCCQWLSVNEIVAKLNLTQPTISHHLAILREAGLVLARQEGKFTYYTLNQEHLVVCCGKLLINFAPNSQLSVFIKNQLEETIPTEES